MLYRLETAFYQIAHLTGATLLSRALYRRRPAILMYHGVTAGAGDYVGLSTHVPTPLFRRQMAYLAAHHNVVPLETLVKEIEGKREMRPHTVAITFDDGYLNNYTQAYPILKEYGLPATIFLITANMGTRSALRGDRLMYALGRTTRNTLNLDGRDLSLQTPTDRQHAYGQVMRRVRQLDETGREELVNGLVRDLGHELTQEQTTGDWSFLTWDQVAEMAQGGITFGAHTAHHVILTRTDLEQAAREVRQSQQDIEARLGHAVSLFAYPAGRKGDYNLDTTRILEQTGFQGAMLAHVGLVEAHAHPLTLGRIGVSGKEGFWHFVASISGLREPLSRLKKALTR